MKKTLTSPLKKQLITLLGSLLLSPTGYAHPVDPDTPTDATVAPEQLENMIITDRSDNLIGIAESASQGNIGQEQLKFRPINRPGEVLETVPGMIASQHSGEGKANQYYLRGFNLDHGTDFLTEIEGVPINQTSHSHGQGWMDTNFLIPDLIETVAFKKGSYSAEYGDFSSTGAANIQYFKSLPETTLKFTGGMFDYYRGLATGSLSIGQGDLLYAGEVVNKGGPWTVSNDYLKFNGVMSYQVENDDSGWSITAMASKADWNATDQIPERAVSSGLIDRFESIDPTDGGASRRYSLTAEWHKHTNDSYTKLMVYGIYLRMALYSNFTYFLDDPINGDQFTQPDERWQSGAKGSHTIYHQIANAESETTFGLQFRNDNIENGLFKTKKREILSTVRSDDVWVTRISPYLDNKTQWNDWLRTNIGVRFDGFRFKVNNSNIAKNNGEVYDGIVSPKLGIILGPWAETELYLNAGLGFHSNDGRGANTQINPATLQTDAPAKPLSRTYSAEIGARTTWIQGLQSTVAFWAMDIDSELIFTGDAGSTEINRASRRYGFELANYYSPTDWLTFDLDFSYSKSQFRGDSAEGNYIPGSIETVVAAGATIHDYHGFFGGPRVRFFGPRPLTEDNSIRSKSTLLLSAMLGYEFNKNWTIQAEAFNLLNRKDSAIDYYYTSRLQGEAAAGVDDIQFHPVEPINFRIGITMKF
jgi:outer membrane receptor protein involved in Fe transport